jgi:hypothetical protein
MAIARSIIDRLIVSRDDLEMGVKIIGNYAIDILVDASADHDTFIFGIIGL